MRGTESQQFHLVIDPLFTSGDGQPQRVTPRETALQAIPVPDHPVALTTDENGSAHLTPPGEQRATAIILEPVCHADRSRLLFLAPRRSPARINGLPAPIVALLDVGDQILHGDELLHVTVYQRPPVGPPAADQIGIDCLLCRGAVERADSVYACACGGLVHVEARRDNEVLECTSLTQNCPRCRKPLIHTEGFSFAPARA